MEVESKIKEQRLAYVAAGSAANTTYYYYLPVLDYRILGLHCEWTAGAGGGTIAVTIEASGMPIEFGTGGDESTLTYRDITNAVFGVASWTDDFIACDNAAKLCGCTWVRVKVVVANKDASTTFAIYSKQLS